MLKSLLNKISYGVHLKIITDYNKNIKYNKGYTFDDAAFSVFLDTVEKLVYIIFTIFAVASFTLFFQKEIIPLLQWDWSDEKRNRKLDY